MKNYNLRAYPCYIKCDKSATEGQCAFDCVYLTMSAEEFSYRTIIMRRRCGVTVTPASSTNDLLTVLIYLSAAVAVHANGADNSRQPG